MTRLVRQEDDFINSVVGGALSGSIVARAYRGHAYSPSGALLFAVICGGTHLLYDANESGSLYRSIGWEMTPDGKDWITPKWFPIRRVTDEELETNEVEFQLRVKAVLDGRLTEEEAEKVRGEYRARRLLLKNPQNFPSDPGRAAALEEGFLTGGAARAGAGAAGVAAEEGQPRKRGWFRWWGGGGGANSGITEPTKPQK